MHVKFTLGEYKIVKLLVSPPGRIRSYREMYDVLHYPGFLSGDGEDGYKMNVRTIIKRVRHKFERVQPDFVHIKNYNRFGYVWEE
jgi:two-component system response regulator ChvI